MNNLKSHGVFEYCCGQWVALESRLRIAALNDHLECEQNSGVNPETVVIDMITIPT